MHKSIFATISATDKQMKKVADEMGLLMEDGTICEEGWWDVYDEVQELSKSRKIFLMNPMSTYVRMIVGYLKKIGIDNDTEILVAEDYGKSWRKITDPLYKKQRKAFRESRMPEEWWSSTYESFNKFIAKLESALPWHFIREYNCEADDVAAVCCRYFKDNQIILVSGDADWEMLCHYPNVRIFSPYSKKYKIVKHPMKVLLEKIQGDVSDNLLTKPSSEMEFDKRKAIVNLLELPKNIELQIREHLDKLTPKKLDVVKLPYKSLKKSIKQLYREADDEN